MGSFGEDNDKGGYECRSSSVPLASTFLSARTHQTELSPGHPGHSAPGAAQTTRHILSRVFDKIHRREDLPGCEAVCTLVQPEEILHHLRHLPGQGTAGPGAGREQSHQEEEEEE